MEEFIKVDKAKYGIETDNGMQLVDLRTLESVRDIIKEFNSEKETGLDFSSGESALVRLVDYKLINSSPYFMGFHMDGCSSTSYRYDEIDIIYRKLWAEKGISLSSAETLISADSAIIRCRKNIPKKKGNPKLYPSVNWKRVREEYASDEEIEQFAFSIATIGNYMPAPIEEQFLLGKLGERFDKELRLIRAYYNPTAYLDMEMIFMKFLGSKKIETQRLILRKVKNEDAQIAFNNWCNSDAVDKYVLWKKHPSVETTIEQYEKWIEEYNDEKTFRWIVELKDTHDLIGTIDVSKRFIKHGSCEIGYCYSDKYWNNGYATEALKAVIKYLFEECEADLVNAEFMENNPASGKVMEKSGMKFEGRLRSRVIDKNNRRNDLLCYSITRDEYYNRNN